MKHVVEIPDYSPSEGLRLRWEDGASVRASADAGEIVIRCNREGLLSLANHFLVLAQAGVPDRSHIHLDEWSGLDEGSCAVIIELAVGGGHLAEDRA
jgi:hypothetical protein